MRKSSAAFAALIAVGALSCRRPLGRSQDAGSDGGAPSVGDGGRLDAPAIDVAPDVAPDLAVDDASPDLSVDRTGDAPPAVCPADVEPLDVCGCGCCGGVAQYRSCYYPALGESRDAIPNPMPTPQECATTGCASGVRHVCCADPGASPASTEVFCAINTSLEDLLRASFTKRDGDTCTTIEIGNTSGRLPMVSTPRGMGNADAWRGKCDGSSGRDYAIGGLGSVTDRPTRPGDTFPHSDVHVALFFDNQTGIADVARIDVDEIALVYPCATGNCPLCGACAFDATYRYALVGGNVPYSDSVALTPPANYYHSRTFQDSNLGQTCAPPPPACGGSAIDVADITAALGDADVQDAFTRAPGAATTPFYGQDQRPFDGPAFQITRAPNATFLIGAPCPAGSTPSSCTEIPGGLSRLEALLRAFDAQQLTDPSCASFAP